MAHMAEFRVFGEEIGGRAAPVTTAHLFTGLELATEHRGVWLVLAEMSSPPVAQNRANRLRHHLADTGMYPDAEITTRRNLLLARIT